MPSEVSMTLLCLPVDTPPPLQLRGTRSASRACPRARHCYRGIWRIGVRPHPYLSTSLLVCLRRVSVRYCPPRPITRYPNGPVTKALAGPAARLHATHVQVIQLWVRAKGAVVVTTTNKEERLKEYLGIERLGLPFCLPMELWPLIPCVGPLTPEEVAAIDTAGELGPGEELDNRCWGGTVRLQQGNPHWLILAMVLGFWAGKYFLGWAFRQQ